MEQQFDDYIDGSSKNNQKFTMNQTIMNYMKEFLILKKKKICITVRLTQV